LNFLCSAELLTTPHLPAIYQKCLSLSWSVSFFFTSLSLWFYVILFLFFDIILMKNSNRRGVKYIINLLYLKDALVVWEQEWLLFL
jgi:hypothetical protein